METQRPDALLEQQQLLVTKIRSAVVEADENKPYCLSGNDWIEVADTFEIPMKIDARIILRQLPGGSISIDGSAIDSEWVVSLATAYVEFAEAIAALNRAYVSRQLT